MEMKDIALMLCNLPEGNYKVETKIGNVEIGSVWLRDRTDFRIITILINGKIYDEITYVDFNYFRLYEKINFENKEKAYQLIHSLVNLPEDTINCVNNDGDAYVIKNSSIINKSKYNTTYNIQSGIFESANKDIKFTYNLETGEKLLYIKKFDCIKDNPTLENDYVCIRAFDGYQCLILGFNKFISSFKNDNLIIDNEEQKQLIDSIKIPTIDIEMVDSLDKEIDEYVKIYQEFVPKLNNYHSEEMIKTLEHVATTLNDKYIRSKQEQPMKKEKKFFNPSRFKNN